MKCLASNLLDDKSRELDTALQASIKALSARIRSQSPVPGHCQHVKYWSRERIPQASSGCLCSHSYFGSAVKMRTTNADHKLSCHMSPAQLLGLTIIDYSMGMFPFQSILRRGNPRALVDAVPHN